MPAVNRLRYDIRRRQIMQRRLFALLYLSALYLIILIWTKFMEFYQLRRVRRWYVRPINTYRNRRGEFHLLVNDFHAFNEAEGHREYFRMDESRMEDLLRRVGPQLIHHQTHALPISPAFRLAFTIKWLASGDSVKHMAKSYRIGYMTARKLIYETCDALWNVLQPEFLSLPTEDKWRQISKHFWKRWNFPLCLGAIDGKHIVIRKPPKAGSGFFNYKLDHSIVLMAVADGNYCFSYVDIGDYGRSGDSGVFGRSTFGIALNDGRNPLGIPGFHTLPGTGIVCPHIFVADDAFPIGGHIMKPYGGRNRDRSQRIFDYRLSRARGIIENTFGILAARWRIFHQPIACWPDNVVKIVKAAVVLHNFLARTDESVPAENRYISPYLLDYANDETGEIVEGNWRHNVSADGALQNLASGSNRSIYGQQVRDRFKEYFQTDMGSVPWQDSRYLALP